MRHDKRQIKRVHLIYYLRIFDAETGVNIGHLVDITTQGMMLISEEDIPVNRDFSFTMMLPATIAGREELNFNAHSLWCKNDFNPDFYLSGYRISNLDTGAVKILTDLIKTYGFKAV